VPLGTVQHDPHPAPLLLDDHRFFAHGTAFSEAQRWWARISVSLPAASVAARYVVISADCHTSGRIRHYEPFLETRFHDEFEDWVAAYRNPIADLERLDADGDWESAGRARELKAYGVIDVSLLRRPAADPWVSTSVVEECPAVYVKGRLSAGTS